LPISWAKSRQRSNSGITGPASTSASTSVKSAPSASRTFGKPQLFIVEIAQRGKPRQNQGLTRRNAQERLALGTTSAPGRQENGHPRQGQRVAAPGLDHPFGKPLGEGASHGNVVKTVKPRHPQAPPG
jgi:hypothetical protein